MHRLFPQADEVKMKTLIDTTKNLSIFVFEDDVVIEEENGILKINDNGDVFFLGDKNFQNTAIYTDVTVPQDWRACLYFYDGSLWSKNNDWVDPSIIQSPNTPIG
tara:strand:- start:113 stop:427 length:315 start_codon:yes stop_codon:yes gene_type:complete